MPVLSDVGDRSDRACGILQRFAHRTAWNCLCTPGNLAPVREYACWLVEVVPKYFAGKVVAVAVWAEHNVASLDPLRNGPERTTCQTCADLGLFGAVLQEDRDVLFIELTPRIREIRAQVLIDLKVGANKAIT